MVDTNSDKDQAILENMTTLDINFKQDIIINGKRNTPHRSA